MNAKIDRRECRETSEARKDGSVLAILHESRRRVRYSSLKAAQLLDVAIDDVSELINAVGDTSGRVKVDEHGQELLCIDPAKWQRIVVAYCRAMGRRDA